MVSTFSFRNLSVFLLLFLISPLFSYARYHSNSHLHASSSTASALAKRQAEKLIRAFNLSPKKPVNIESYALDTPNLVERPLKFPSLIGPGPSVENLGHHAGYYKLPNTNDARMFYFFFESRNSNDDPVVIWLTGGPGCGSELALFYENGPFHVAQNLSLSWNDFGWDKASNLLYVDQPTGTGFSYSSDESDIRHDEEGVSNDLYSFLQEFFKGHPQFAKTDFYITGESYAGHYIPALASRVVKGNKAKEGIHINLKGIAIGNGLTNPEIQYPAYPDYALNMKLIGKSDYDSIKQIVPDCENAAKACGTKGVEECENSYSICSNIFDQILLAAGNINYYDIRKQCEGTTGLCYDFSAIESFLNHKSVREALGVTDIEFVSCSTRVYNAMAGDWMRNLAVGIPDLLQNGIRVLVYAGEYDLICNWLGNSNWVNALAWSGSKEFGSAPTVPFVVDGGEAGQLKSHGPLSFLKVHNAGHLVPMDQPKASLQMLSSWMQGKLAENAERVSPN